jgi:hypothetical protein
MQTANLEFVIGQAQHPQRDDAIGAAVAASTEAGFVVPSILRGKLEEAGFKVVDDEVAMSEYGFKTLKTLKRVLVTNADGAIVAMGASSDHADALLHAMLGFFRENSLGDAEVPEGLMEAPTQPEG